MPAVAARAAMERTGSASTVARPLVLLLQLPVMLLLAGASDAAPVPMASRVLLQDDGLPCCEECTAAEDGDGAMLFCFQSCYHCLTVSMCRQWDSGAAYRVYDYACIAVLSSCGAEMPTSEAEEEPRQAAAVNMTAEGTTEGSEDVSDAPEAVADGTTEAAARPDQRGKRLLQAAAEKRTDGRRTDTRCYAVSVSDCLRDARSNAPGGSGDGGDSLCGADANGIGLCTSDTVHEKFEFFLGIICRGVSAI